MYIREFNWRIIWQIKKDFEYFDYTEENNDTAVANNDYTEENSDNTTPESNGETDEN